MYFQISAQCTLSPELKQNKTKRNITSSKYSKPLIQILLLTWTFHRIYLICKTNIHTNKVTHRAQLVIYRKGIFLTYRLRFIRSAPTIDIIFKISSFDHTIVHKSNPQSDITRKIIFSIVLYNQTMLDINTFDHSCQSIPSFCTWFDVIVTRGTMSLVPKLTMISIENSD